MSFSNFVFSKSTPGQNKEENDHKVKSFSELKNKKIDNLPQTEGFPTMKLRPNEGIAKIRKINTYNDLPINKKKLPLLGIKPRNQHIESKQKNNETKTKQKEAKRIITNYKEN